MKNPFAPKTEASSHAVPPKDGPHKRWHSREGDGIAHGRSSLFVSQHDAPLAPERTCIQGHDILPGQDVCSHGHPVG